MKKVVISVALLFSVTHCYSQDKYIETLGARLNEISQLSYFDNNIITFEDTVDFPMSFPYWNPTEKYYEGDIVRFGNCHFGARTDVAGEMPTVMSDKWGLIRGPHPYLFLRDTAKVEDLERSLDSDSAYVRAYSFAALSYRKWKGSFKTIVRNLQDNSKILEVSTDVESYVYPVEMMMRYGMNLLTEGEKRKIERLIEKKYPHLKESYERYK
jgi:hypothetical protein